MKCQNCGKSEVNFHYSSNINGCVTETFLCSECAAKSGYDFGSMFGSEMLNDVFSQFGPRSMFLPIPMFGLDMISPFFMPPRIGIQPNTCDCEGSCEVPVRENHAAEVDDDMQKQREINLIRNQMRLAAEKEDYEKAAELRDQIKQMEAE